MKYSVFSLILPEFTFEEQVHVLHETGYDAIEIRVADIGPEFAGKPFSYWGNHKDPVGPSNIASRTKALLAAGKAAGIEICALAPYASVTEPEGFEPLAAAAEALGAGIVRVTAPRYDGKEPYEKLLEDSVRGLERIEETAREIHMGTIAPSASAMRRILEGFDPEAVGAILDPGNIVYEGFERWKMATDILGPYLAHVHVKNASWTLKSGPERGPFIWEPGWAGLREGQGNWSEIMDALRGAGYDGYLSLEDFTGQPIRERLAESLAFLKTL